ncbi:glycosyltransferase family 4 protein [uncultured Sphingomonas sp.]|uniref:glycosyltransferase family 4 protein n=1 Tax=uncultured Sphingomonas sp. TaxID=158754 RepID=UPI00345CABFA
MSTVCIDCRYIGPRPSGIGEVVRNLIACLPGMAPDLRFVLLRNPLCGTRLSTAPNVVEWDVAAPANGPRTMWGLSRVVDFTDVDLFHATFNIMPARLPVPCVTTIHDIMWLTNPAWCRTGPRGWIERHFYSHGIRRAIRSSRAIAAVSRASADAIAAYAPHAADRTHVTLSGVSVRFRPVEPDQNVLTSLGLRPDRPFILTVGQYAPYKNHEGALRGFAKAFSHRPEIDLVLVQRMGKATHRLLELAKSLGIADRVQLVPTVSEQVLLSLYAMAKALLHPSFCEGFGNPIAEAMACGCPVVTSNRSAMPEVTGGASLLAAPDDPAAIARALTMIVDDEKAAACLRRTGLERAAQLQWNAFAEANLAIYRSILADRS